MYGGRKAAYHPVAYKIETLYCTTVISGVSTRVCFYPQVWSFSVVDQVVIRPAESKEDGIGGVVGSECYTWVVGTLLLRHTGTVEIIAGAVNKTDGSWVANRVMPVAY